MVFRDERFDSIAIPATAPGDEALIRLYCRRCRRPDGGDTIGDLIMIAPWTPIIGVALGLWVLSPDQSRVLDTIRIGEPPPGGLESFLAERQQTVSVEWRTDGDADLRVGPARVLVRDGLVAEISGGEAACRLVNQASLDCGAR